MAAYTYKQVTHRDDYLAAIALWQEQSGRESNEDPGYDGDCWLVTECLLDQKDATLARVTAERDELLLTLRSATAERDGLRAEIRWLQSIDCHGCVTGDCPCNSSLDCADNLRRELIRIARVARGEVTP